MKMSEINTTTAFRYAQRLWNNKKLKDDPAWNEFFNIIFATTEVRAFVVKGMRN